MPALLPSRVPFLNTRLSPKRGVVGKKFFLQISLIFVRGIDRNRSHLQISIVRRTISIIIAFSSEYLTRSTVTTRLGECAAEFAWLPIIGSLVGRGKKAAAHRGGRNGRNRNCAAASSRRPRRSARYSWRTIYYAAVYPSQWNFFSGILSPANNFCVFLHADDPWIMHRPVSAVRIVWLSSWKWQGGNSCFGSRWFVSYKETFRCLTISENVDT